MVTLRDLPIYEIERDVCRLSTDRSRLDLDLVYSYWLENPIESAATTASCSSVRSKAPSGGDLRAGRKPRNVCAGGDRPAGLRDVFTLPAHRGRRHIWLAAPTLRSEFLCEVPIVAVMRADEPLAGKRESTPGDRDRKALISYGSHAEIGMAVDSAFADAGRQRNVAIQIASSVGAAPLMRESLGTALVDGLVAWRDLEGMVARPFLPRVHAGGGGNQRCTAGVALRKAVSDPAQGRSG